MTISARIVKAIVTLPILGTVSRDEHGEVIKRGEKYLIKVYAAKPDWKEKKSFRDMLYVGALSGQGYTESPYKRALDAVLPEGHELVALRFDDLGIPCWEGLPIHINQWFTGEGWMLVKEGQIFINDALIQPGAIQSYSMTIGVNTVKTTADKVREIVLRYLNGEATEYNVVDDLCALVKQENEYTKLSALISEQIRNRIKQEQQPGGLLHKR
jgi:hypothetical protein